MLSDERPGVLGVSASHNGSACLLKGDEIIVAIQEERLCKLKRHRIYGAGPSLAPAYCLSYAGIEPDELDIVVLCVRENQRSPA
jgi:carbamoyltransferase